MTVATAAPALAAQDAAEPRVARVGFVEGATSYLNADADEWTPVDVNAPLVTGDRFYAGADGRAEIELPGGVDARLSNETELDLLEVSSSAVQLRLGEGTATFRVRNVPAGLHVEVSTPAAAVVVRSRGVYRIDVAADGETTVLVREGEADAFAGDQRYRLEQGRGARISGGADAEGGAAPPIEVFDASAVPADPWDRWEQGRAARVVKSASVKYVDPDVYGVQDLDQYGSWSRDESYGPIWRPTQVDAGWAPFTQGRWVWQDPWGWTWVDYAPWGWAPSHYGRWVYTQDAWGWAPGPVVARPVYAPATVGFFGLSVNTPGVSVSVGIGPSVGWVPLGYGEPLIPWWGGIGGVQLGRPWWGGWGGPRIVNNTVINQTNITNINVNNIHYANFDRPRGFTAVSRESFVRGDLQRVDVPRERLHEIAHPLRGAPDVIPQRDSLFATRPEKLRQGPGKEPSREILLRASVSTRAVPGRRPAFDDKVKLIEQGKGAPVAPRELQRLARGNGNGTGNGAAQPQLRTVAAQGRHAIVPEVTAEAPAQASAPIQRRARTANPADSRQAATGERGDRAAAPANAAPTRDEVSRHGGRPQGGDAPRDARSPAQREQRDVASPREETPPAAVGRVGEPPNSATGRAAVAHPAADRAVENGRGESARGERGVPAQRQAAPDAAARAAGEQPQPRPQRATREAVATPQRGDEQQQRAQAERQRQAQQQAERTQRDAATRQQRDSEQRAQAQAERQQQQQAERAREDAARQQRDSEQRARAQAERQQQHQADRARQDAAHQQRDSAARAQRDAQQRQQAARPQPQQQQRQQAVERQHGAPAPSDPREAKRQERKKPQQPERDRQPGA